MTEKTMLWDDLALFLAVAREGGLSRASRVSGRSPATLGRRMHVLERAMGCELFIRHQHGYETTGRGQWLVTELASIEARIQRLSTHAGQPALPLVKVSAGTWTTMALLDHLDSIAGEPPDVRVRFVADEDVLSIAQREVVIGFRNRRPTLPGLAGRRLRRIEFAPYATPDAPDRWIQVLAGTPSAQWMAKQTDHCIACEVNSPRPALDLALAGKGIAILPTFIGDARTTLHRYRKPIEELSHDQWIVTHQDDRDLPEVRRTIDRLCSVLLPDGILK